MKKLIGIAIAISMVTVLTGCPSDDHRYKRDKHGKYKKSHHGKHYNRLPGDNAPPAPNCAADGPGCRQFNPSL